MRVFSLLLSVALTSGCGGTVVTQQLEAQPGSPAKEQTPAAVTEGQPKEVVNSIGIKLLLIPAGTFTMGSPAAEKGRDDDETQHQVTLSKPFYMGRTEVTQGQWKRSWVRNHGKENRSSRKATTTRRCTSVGTTLSRSAKN
jgi:formylglycine-generating enzyme required for sulfatase activity